MRTFLECLAHVETNNQFVFENASSGATNASNIAAVPCVVGSTGPKGSIGAGFDPNGDWGVYGDAKKKRDAKPVVIRRMPVGEGREALTSKERKELSRLRRLADRQA